METKTVGQVASIHVREVDGRLVKVSGAEWKRRWADVKAEALLAAKRQAALANQLEN